MLMGFHTVKTGNERNVNVFRRFNGKLLMYIFLWKVAVYPFYTTQHNNTTSPKIERKREKPL